MLEEVMNRYLQLDPETPKRLKALKGKTFALTFAELPLILYFIGETDRLRIILEKPEHVDATLTTTLPSLLSLHMNPQTNPSAGHINLRGDAELGLAMQRLFSELDIDWEYYIAQFTGDIIAHQLGDAARKLQLWGQQQWKATHQNITEYLQEESQQLPPREALEHFYNDVDGCQLSVDRLAERIQRLEKKSL